MRRNPRPLPACRVFTPDVVCNIEIEIKIGARPIKFDGTGDIRGSRDLIPENWAIENEILAGRQVDAVGFQDVIKPWVKLSRDSSIGIAINAFLKAS